jgi:hypothetical protein
MNLLPFLRQKAMEKGIKTCPNCDTEDIFYSLNGMCLECNGSLPPNDKIKSLQFATELFTEFFEKHDSMFTSEQKKIPVQFLKGLVHNLSNKGSLENEKIIKLQSIIKNIGTIGSNEAGGAIKMENGKPSLQLLENHTRLSGDPFERVKSFAAVILAMQYILDFKVKNEFVLDTAKSHSSSTASSTSKTNSQSGKGGCLSMIVFLVSTSLLLIIIIAKFI